MKYSFPIALALMPLSIGVPANAEDHQLLLWRELQLGDTPEAVASKLEKHPDIKNAKAKTGRNASVSITYRNGGVEIFGLRFKLVLDFEGGNLKQVSMGTDKQCTNDSSEVFSNMLRALLEKYPNYIGPTGTPMPIELQQALHKGTDENPEMVGRFLTDGKIVVIYNQSFTSESPPPRGYTSNAAVNALSQLLWNQYRAREGECDGTGNARVRHILTYMPKENFEKMMRELKKADIQKIESAKINL